MRPDGAQKESPARQRGACVSAQAKELNMNKVRDSLPIGKVWSEVTTVTPEQARHLRETCHFEWQRNLSAKHIHRLATEMAAGRFIRGTQIFLCVLPDRSMVIVNGNHTLEAVALCDIPQSLTLSYIAVSDFKEASRIYARFDIHKARTWADAMRACGVGEAKPAQWAAAANSALRFSLGGFGRQHAMLPALHSRDIVLQMFSDYEPFVDLMMTAVASNPTTKLFRRGGVLSIALETFRYQATGAIKFWTATARDDGLRNDQPQKALLRFLQNITGKLHGTGAHRQAAIGSMLAWNAFYENRPLSVLNVGGTKHWRIAGTPWRNGRNPLIEEYLEKGAGINEAATAASAAAPHNSFTGTGIGTDGAPVAMFMGSDDAND